MNTVSAPRESAGVSGFSAWGWDRWVAVVGVLVGVLFAAVSHRDLAFAVDQNNYLGGAESLAAGKGYREAYVVGEPRCTIYPPLFPAYLSFGFRLGGPWPGSLEWVAYGQWLLSGLAGGLTYVLLRQQQMAPRWAIPWTLMLLSSGCWHLIVNGLFSESLMQPLVLGLLLWVGRARGRGFGHSAALGLLLAAVYLTRSASTAIVGGALLVVLAHGRSLGWRRVLAVFVPVLIAVVGWKLWTVGGHMTYASSFVDVVRDGLGVSGYARLVGSNLLSIATGWDALAALCPLPARILAHPMLSGSGLGLVAEGMVRVVGAFGMGLVAWGLWRRRRSADVWVAGVLGLYLLQNSLWWYWLGDRGMLVVLPLLVVWGHEGLRALAGVGESGIPSPEALPANAMPWRGPVKPTSRARIVWGAVAVVLGGGILANTVLAVRVGQGTGKAVERKEIEDAGRWVQQHAGANDVVAAASDIPLPHFTHAAGRRVVGVPRSQIAVVPGVVPTLAVVRVRPNRYMPQPGPLGETLYTTEQQTFAIRRVDPSGAVTR